jgi:hypothetical protein
VAGGKEDVEAESMVITDDAIQGSRFVATKDGFAVEALTATNEGAVYAAAVGTVKKDEEAEDASTA